MGTSRLVWRAVALVGGAGVPTGLAARGNVIQYQCGVLAPVVVADGDPEDLDPAERHIRVNFDCTVVAGINSWRARGTILGIADPPVIGGATTSLTDLTIENLTGNVNGHMFQFAHSFFQLGPPAPENSFDLSGHFDNVLHPGILNGARLDYVAQVVALGGAVTPIGADGTGVQAGAAPIPFAFEGGPVVVFHPIEHRGEMIFYLDSPGDAILVGEGEGWNIQAVPAPGATMATAFVLAGLSRRRRRPVDAA